MPDERFRFEQTLLTNVRADGWEAYAWDTGNTWRYSAPSATWLLVVPAAGQPGQVLQVDPASGISGYAAPASASSVAMPVDFSSGSSTEVYNETISGGTLGAHGILRVRILAGNIQDSTGSPRTITLTGTATQGGAMSSFSVVSASVQTGDTGLAILTGFIDMKAEIANAGDEASQVALTDTSFFAVLADGTSPGATPDRHVNVPVSLAVDTARDWQLQFAVQAEVAMLSSEVQAVIVEQTYIP